MATSGSINSSGSWATATLSWSRTSVDTANNRSTISYTLSLYRQYNISSSASKDYSIKINGSTVASGTTTIGGSGTKTIKTGSVTIPHNSDGTKTFSFSFSLEMGVTLSGTYVGTLSASGSSTLDSIPRTSQITVSSSSVNYGSSITIYTNRASTSFTHTLRYSWNGRTGTIATGVTDSRAWTIPNSFMDYIPNATSTTGTIYCDTYSGSTKIGTDSLTVTTNVPSNIVPSFSSVTHSETVTAVSSTVGGYVQGLSRLKLTISGASGTYSSSITSYEISFDGVNYSGNGITTGIVKGSGTLVATGKITDSRGRVATRTTNITVLAYSPPRITALSVTRSNSDSTNNETGVYAKITRSATVSSLVVGGTQKNTLTFTIKTKPRSSSTWTTNVSATTLPSGQLSMSGVSNIGTFPITTSYDVRFEVSDKFNTTISLAVLPTGQVTMSWGATGIGVGKVWERGALDVSGEIRTDSQIYANGSMSVGNNLNNQASIQLDWKDNIPRLRYGGSGNGALNGFEIQGTGDKVKLKVYDNGDLWTTGRLVVNGESGNQIVGLFRSSTQNPNLALTRTDVNKGFRMEYNSVGELRFQTSNGDGVFGGETLATLTESGDFRLKSDKTLFGKIAHASGYLTVYSYDTSSHGDGSGRIYYTPNSKKFVMTSTQGGLANLEVNLIGTSDRDKKTNIRLDEESALIKINSTPVYNFNYIEDLKKYEEDENGERYLIRELDESEVKCKKGIMWDEAPEDIKADGGVKGINMYNMSALMWKAIQELSGQVNAMSEKIKRK